MHALCRRGDAGIVAEHVQPPVALATFCDQRDDVSGPTHVAENGRGTSVDAVDNEVCGEDARAFVHEPLRHRLPEPRARTGHERYLAFESTHKPSARSAAETFRSRPPG